ncbi:MAG: hypothetical protein KC415_13205 [Anaerolineales bacterium]|nr:hypothetical protein [Anaerolineales bacterium]MCB8990075.1 hypothetical protein [Ardenticatenaceae bacterium]
MNRVKGILAAGTLTGLVIVTLLALGFRNSSAAAADNASPVVIPSEPGVDPAAQDAVQAWQTYSSELENTVRTLQARETQYQTELAKANQTITQLQDQLNNTNSQTFAFSGGHEHEEHEGFDHDD